GSVRPAAAWRNTSREQPPVRRGCGTILPDVVRIFELYYPISCYCPPRVHECETTKVNGHPRKPTAMGVTPQLLGAIIDRTKTRRAASSADGALGERRPQPAASSADGARGERRPQPAASSADGARGGPRRPPAASSAHRVLHGRRAAARPLRRQRLDGGNEQGAQLLDVGLEHLQHFLVADGLDVGIVLQPHVIVGDER